jgi:cysteine desulfurase
MTQHNQPIYLDYMASTPLDPAVKEIMIKCLDNKQFFGNPTSQHIYGYQSAMTIATAREQLASYFETSAKDWTFTSGATEAINLAIHGVASNYKNFSKKIITFESEHAATIQCCKQLISIGFEVDILPVMKNGLIDLNLLEEKLKHDVLLVSVLHVNNEIGVIQPIEEIAKLAKKYNTFIHIDAVQTIGKTAINLNSKLFDLVSISGHKNYGPKGVGALYINPESNIKLKPIIFGGGQEHGIRSGTLATHQIAGMGQAYKLSKDNYLKDLELVKSLYNHIITNIVDNDNIILNGCLEHRVPHNISLTFKDINSEVLISHLNNFAFSLGSACQASSNRPSHVLMAIGHTQKQANNTIRLSIGKFNTMQEIELLINDIKTLINTY